MHAHGSIWCQELWKVWDFTLLISYQVSLPVSWMLAEDVDQRQKALLTEIAVARGSAFSCVSSLISNFHRWQEEARLPACAVGCSAGEEPWTKETWTTIVGCKQICPPLQTETLSLSSKTDLYSNVMSVRSIHIVAGSSRLVILLSG